MHKIITLISFFVVSIAVYAQPFAGMKFCINPGHGGHDSDDRFIEATGFWESEGNLTKGLYFRDILERMGAQVVMSRTTNTSNDDLPLSTISQIANDNNVDFFHSIHSNAFTGSTNYPLMLFRGYDNDPVFDEAKVMSQIMWTQLFNNGTSWSYKNPNVRGDWTFYNSTGGLGVLRNLAMEGVLSEGSFHDYIQESWRLKNDAYLLREAYVFVKSFIEYYKLPTMTDGIVHGIVRDKLKNSEYFSLNGTNDAYKALNKVKVTLLPNNVDFFCDEKNNGYFLFDSIAVGDYKLVFQLDEYMNDTVDITILANQMLFVEEFLPLDTLRAPKVLLHTPKRLNSTDSVNSNQKLIITFDRPMDKESTEAAFSIYPPHNMIFSWEKEGQILVASPATPFEKATLYSVNISADAMHAWNVKLPDVYTFEFLTKNRNRLSLVERFPAANATEISNRLQFFIQFDAPLQPESLIGAVTLKDANGNTKEISKAKITAQVYVFEPTNALELNTTYTLTIDKKVCDTNGNSITENISYSFTTLSQAVPEGVVIYDFDAVSDWKDPEFSGTTVGTDGAATTFRIWNYLKVYGSGSGRLIYSFTGENGGICRVYNGEKKSIGANQGVEVGMWIFGDYSKNNLELWYFHSGETNAVVSLGKIDWAGWKYCSFPMSSIGGTGERFFHSIVVVQTNEGAKSGTIYFDNAQIYSEALMDVDEQPKNSKQVFRCYPNPATSVLNITGFEQNGWLRLMDITGRVIHNQTVTNTGNFISLDVSNLKTGLYFVSFTNLLGEVTTLKLMKR